MVPKGLFWVRLDLHWTFLLRRAGDFLGIRKRWLEKDCE